MWVLEGSSPSGQVLLAGCSPQAQALPSSSWQRGQSPRVHSGSFSLHLQNQHAQHGLSPHPSPLLGARALCLRHTASYSSPVHSHFLHTSKCDFVKSARGTKWKSWELATGPPSRRIHSYFWDARVGEPVLGRLISTRMCKEGRSRQVGI